MPTLAEIDEVLIRYGDTMSLNALSFKIKGILTPEQCGARLIQLTDTPEWLTAAREDRLITLKMRLIITELSELTLTTRSAEVMLNGLEKLGNRLDKRNEATEKDLKTLYAFQGEAMFEAIDIALQHMKAALTGGPVTEERWDQALESGLRLAQLKLESYDGDEGSDESESETREITTSDAAS